MLNKGNRSLQLRMNTLIPKLGKAKITVDKSAYSRARHKLKHTAFIELNRRAVIDTMYEDGDYQKWRGHRLLAIDGSKIFLPENPATTEEFGTLPYAIKQRDIEGEHVFAVASVMYDVLNNISIDAKLEHSHSYEVDIAKEHLQHTEDNDLVIYDRGYCSFRMMALASMANGDFLIRARGGKSFRVADEMLKGKGPGDVVVKIKPSKNRRKAIRLEGLPTELEVRFVRVKLKNGEYEVLVTSLTDQKKYPPKVFKDLYYVRWGIETFYGILKNRLNLENFSGLSPEAIRQDFYVTIFLSGAESILTLDAEDKLSKQKGGQPKKVNKAVSFNVIKERAFEIFYAKQSANKRLMQLTELFITSPTKMRKDRITPRIENSSRQVLSYYKRQHKSVF
jgi:Transposase DDE domain